MRLAQRLRRNPFQLMSSGYVSVWGRGKNGTLLLGCSPC